MEQENSAVEAAEAAAEAFLTGQPQEPAPTDDEEPVAGDEREVAPIEEGEEGEEIEVPEETGEVEYVELEYNGKLYEVPSELQDALMMQSDYTQKTQDVAAQRKAVEAQVQAVEQRAQEFAFAESIREDVMKAEQLEATANQYQQYLRDNIESLSSTDIEKIRLTIEDTRQQRDQLVQAVQGKSAEFQQAQEQSRQELLKKGTEILKSKIPDWGQSHQEQVRNYALSLGFTDAEINTVIDPRHVEVLYKASQYDALQQGKSTAVKKVQKAPAIKPRARDPKSGKFVKQQKLKKALKSNLPASDKAALIGDDIASRFFS